VAIQEVEYGFEPVIECLFSRVDAERRDCVYFLLAEEDTARIVKSQREHRVAETAEPELHTIPSPAIALDSPAAIAIALSREVYNNLLAVVDSCNRVHETNEGATTHARLDIPGLLGMLAEDAAMTNSRPGSWEGANLQQVLDSHGYCF
jgi:hypothetical protein